MKSLSFFILFIFFSAHALASVQLYVWQATPTAQRLILPRLENENPQAALERYLFSIAQHVSIQNELIPFHLPKISGTFSVLENSVSTTKIRTGLIGNMLIDIVPLSERIIRNVKRFHKAGGDIYVIAPAADLNLNEASSTEYRELIAKNFDLLVSLGGYDLHNKITGLQSNMQSSMSAQSSLAIDQSELNLIAAFKKAAKGVFLGICRGHQISALADGHQLYPDISESNIGLTKDHITLAGHNAQEMLVWHPVHIFDSLLMRLVKGLKLPQVFSAHHMAVKVMGDAASVEVAQHQGINEALESRNGHSISFQFHIEMPEEISGNKEFSDSGLIILRRVLAYSRLIKKLKKKGQDVRSCRSLLKSS